MTAADKINQGYTWYTGRAYVPKGIYQVRHEEDSYFFRVYHSIPGANTLVDISMCRRPTDEEVAAHKAKEGKV